MALVRSTSLFLVAAASLCGCAVLPGMGGEQIRGSSQQQHPGHNQGILADSAQLAIFRGGVVLLRAGNADSAARIFASVAKQNPELAAAYVNLGTARLLQNRPDAARQAYQKAVQIDPGQAVAWVRLGILYRRANAYAKAEHAYLAAIHANPDNPYAHLNLGVLYDDYMQKPQQALAQYQRYQALLDTPDSEVALWIARLKQQL